MPVSKKILVVDDSSINRKILKRILSEDFVVLEAEHGREALDVLALHSQNTAAIMLDLMMPVMDGFELLKALAADVAYQNIPVIVTTGNSDRENELRALGLGAWDFVTKPYDPPIIKFRLKNAIDRSQLAAFEQLKYLAEYDTLTGVFNKTKFFTECRRMLDGRPTITFMFIRLDIDRFNLVNGFYGTAAGDTLLQYVADSIRLFASGRPHTVYGRIEGDIFGILTPYLGVDTTEEIVQESRRQFKAYNLELDVVPTFGFYVIDEPSLEINTMYDRANLAAKTVKGSYTNLCAYYDDTMGEAVAREQSIINEMRTALEEKQFVIYFQPKYSCITSEPAGAEALVRWIHPVKGLVSPGDFIPVFERNGFIVALDYYVWERVCQYLRKWLDEGRKPNPVSVNVSRVNLYNPQLVEQITGLVKKYNLPMDLLNLELTESAYTDNPEMIQETTTRLKEAGFTIMMDDFGSGYSSLNILKDLDVDVLKIDMRFLSNAKIPGRGENIIASVVRMAKWLSIPTIAEGVEEKQQVDFLQGIGCDYIQGYYFARPMPAADYEALMENHGTFKETLRPGEETGDIWSNNPQMEMIFSNESQAVVVYEYINEQIEALRINRGFYETFGFEDTTIKSTNLIDQVEKEYRETLIDAFETVSQSRETASCEYVRRTPGKNSRWVHLDLRYLNKVGGKDIIFGNLTDITAQKEIDRELQKYQDMLATKATVYHRMLIVDDVEINRDILAGIFKEDFAIAQAENGRAALTLLEEGEKGVDIVLLDLIMPVMDGIAFLEYREAHPALKRIPVVIISVDDTPELQIKALDLGANDYITKPFVEEVVRRRIDNVLQSSRSQ